MGKIVILDENTANQIAAGEVIERPASIVKEMVENALDAKATAITVDITNGGIKSIRITDNGDGIDADDIEMAFERHATSKIRRIDDLDKLATMGFRGEALASIASVAKVEVITKTEDAASGTRVFVEAGNILSVEPTGAPKGTSFIVRELFFNTPARYKFLKKDATEAGYIQDILARIALARPDVSIKYINQGRTLVHTPGNHDLLSVIYSIYGKEIARAVIPIQASNEGLEVTGFIGKPEVSRGNRGFQSILINGRFVHNRVITAALEEAFRTRLMQKRFPFAVLDLKMSPQFVDVNVHPAKLEVRFSDEQKVFRAIYHAVSDALSGISLIPKVEEKIQQNNRQSKPYRAEQIGMQTGMQTKPAHYEQRLDQNRPSSAKEVELHNSSLSDQQQNQGALNSAQTNDNRSLAMDRYKSNAKHFVSEEQPGSGWLSSNMEQPGNAEPSNSMKGPGKAEQSNSVKQPGKAEQSIDMNQAGREEHSVSMNQSGREHSIPMNQFERNGQSNNLEQVNSLGQPGDATQLIRGQELMGKDPSSLEGKVRTEPFASKEKPSGNKSVVDAEQSEKFVIINEAVTVDDTYPPVQYDDREKLNHARIVGQAFESFILLEEGEELLLIDQHAAHERIRYEKIKQQFIGQQAYSQGLLSPLAINLSELEMDQFHGLTEYFKKLGFEAEDFGDRTILIRAIPYILDSGFSAQDFLDILEKLCREVPSASEIIPEETLYMMACKSAIKANRTMSTMEIRGLVSELAKTQNPYTCVHGRPVIISMSKKEMEKRFKRIV